MNLNLLLRLRLLRSLEVYLKLAYRLFFYSLDDSAAVVCCFGRRCVMGSLHNRRHNSNAS